MTNQSYSTPLDVPQAKKKRIIEVDTMRGIGIFLMVFGHSFLIYPIDFFHQPGYYEFNRWIYTFHMELLFLVAGAVYHCSNYSKYINKKIDRIVVPYLLFGFVSLLFHASSSSLVNQHNDLSRLLYQFLLSGGCYWFLYTIFMIFLIYPLLEKIFNEPWKEIALIIALLAITDLHPTTFLCIRKVALNLPFFIIGKYAIRNIDELRPANGLRAILTIVAMAVLWAITNHFIYQGHFIATLRLLRTMSMVMVVFIIAVYLKKWAETGRVFPQRLQSLLALCSQYSLQLYLFDAFLMVIIRTILCNLLHISHPIIILFFMTTVNIATTLLLCHYVLKKNKLIAWLTGLGNRPWVKSKA